MVKKYQIDKEIYFPGITVLIKEIEIDKFRPDPNIEKLQENFRGPWYHEFAQRLPFRLGAAFIKLCYFYSTPYEFGDTGTLRLKGILLFNTDNPYPENQLLEAVDIYLYDEDMRYYHSSRGTIGNSLSNYRLFSVESENAPLNKKTYKILVKDRRHDDLRSFEINPEWELHTYTDFYRRTEQYPFDPFNIIHDGFLTPMRQGRKGEARRRLQPGAGEERLWAILDHDYWAMGGTDHVIFEGSRGGFDGVYSSNIVFGHYESGYTPDDLIPVARQKLFFVIQNGSPEIIDADPAVVVQEN